LGTLREGRVHLLSVYRAALETRMLTTRVSILGCSLGESVSTANTTAETFVDLNCGVRSRGCQEKNGKVQNSPQAVEIKSDS
jgi:hypothetical protein